MDCSATVFVDVLSNFLTFSVFWPVLGPPENSSSSTEIRLALKRECHSNTAVRLKECSRKASRSISRVSIADLPSLMQKLMQTRYSIWPSIADETKHDSEKPLV
jgi:hypothetical protein